MKKKLRCLSAFTLLVVIFSKMSIAQSPSTASSFIGLIKSVPTKGWYKFNTESSSSATIFFSEFKNIFGLSNSKDMSIIRVDQDNIGMKHYRFQQTYQHIPVEGAIFLLHEKEGKVISGNGNIIKNISLSVTPSISDNAAVDLAKKYTNASVYLWEDVGAEATIKQASNNPNATFVPKPELVIVDPSFSADASKYRLAWKMKIYSLVPVKGEMIYVDAASGAIIHTLSLIQETNVPGTAITKYSGTRTIVVDSLASNNFVLHEATRGIGQGMVTYNVNKKVAYAGATDFVDTDNNWNNVNAQQDEAATDAHWGTEMTYDYYLQKHGRNSYNNQGGKLISYLHFSTNYVNAFWNGYWMTYGDGNGSTYKILTSLDVCGHEITHGVTQQTAALIYLNESGALNESFSDIMGTSIEFFAKPGTANWNIGEDFGVPFRSMASPKLYGQPDTYKGVNWYVGTGDYGGVHTNSGVQNKWYNLISAGGTGTNDLGDTYNVTAIGIDKGSQIAYRNLVYYITSTSQYADARQGSIFAAEDIFGSCSQEVYQTANAWYAVGVGDPIGDKDMGILKLTTVASACGLTSNEPVQALIRYSGCSTIPSGDTVYVSYKLDGASITTDTLKLSTALNPGDSILHNFNKNADFSVVGIHTLKGWVHYRGDTLAINDTIQKVVVENRLAQNFDVKMSALLSPIANCSLGSAETVKLLAYFNGCDSMLAGIKLPFAYKINGGAINRDTLTLTKTLHPKDSITLSFKNKVNLSAKGQYKFDVWSLYAVDTIHKNDSLKGVIITNPYLPGSNVITFEDSVHVLDSVYITTGAMANVFVSPKAKKTGKFGLLMTGGNWIANRNSYTKITDLNVWTANSEFSSKMFFCVDATAMSKLYMHFDLRQTVERSLAQLTGYGYPYTSNLRVLVNGIPVSKTYNTTLPQFSTIVLNLNAFAGQSITVCIEAKNYQSFKYDVTGGLGDCAYLDNIYFSPDSTALAIGIKEINSTNPVSVSVFPNPNDGTFSLLYNTANAGKVKVELRNILGEIVYQREEKATIGKNLFMFNSKELPTGVYFIVVQNETNRIANKFMVSH